MRSALAEPDGPHLAQRPDRQRAPSPPSPPIPSSPIPRSPPAHDLDARDERRGHGAKPDEQDAKLAGRGRDVPAASSRHELRSFPLRHTARLGVPPDWRWEPGPVRGDPSYVNDAL